MVEISEEAIRELMIAHERATDPRAKVSLGSRLADLDLAILKIKDEWDAQ